MATFKYGALLANSTTKNISNSDDGIISVLLNLPLPIGISFYTFEGISLLVDALREKSNIDYIYNPILYSTRFYIPMLRQEYQPVSVFLPMLSSIKHRLMNRESVTNNLSNIRQVVNIDPILTDKLIAQQIEINKVPLTEKEKVLLRK
ncbi:MAG TPA: hypothetical protein V6D14_14345 [Coleofasciculaceae cyanobacterium]